MIRVLLTGFEPFGRWDQNSSALCVSVLSKRKDLQVALITEIYSVDFARARNSVERDLQQGFDFALHLGQHEISSCIRLERVARNIMPARDGRVKLLVRNGPAELRTNLPLPSWNRLLKEQGIPSTVSHDAGCFLCNAVFYWSLYYTAKNSSPTQSVFIHLPLAKRQVSDSLEHLPALETRTCADAIEIVVRELVRQKKASVATEVVSLRS